MENVPMTQLPMARQGQTFQDLVRDAKTRIQEVTLAELMQWREDGQPLVVLDVREMQDFEAGHIPAATHLSRGVLELDIDEVVPDQNARIVTYCGGGSRSALAADTLQVMGYRQVYSLAGGYRGWKAHHA
jgi:rhodanese-related sulfurtransferase